ncbi:HelD family protein [Phycicoccus avicenniae]|uniref:HelD family protein n=1 Tax=Phycicoccus avicenniae TaxID=2828860 RepID=UPI003D2A0260
MTAHHPAETSPEVAAEVATEQAHVDRVYAELAKASLRAADVEADGLARGRTDRTGDVRDEEMTGLFERDALVFAAARRRAMIDTQYEGLVFGRLDLGEEDSTAAEREVRHIGRLGVRDDDYEPLVVDWRAPAAAAFYRATPVEPMGVVRRRVLRCSGARVVGVEDDLMVPVAPDDIVVVGDGALMAALTRSRGRQMRDIVATIQRHQDEAIRAPSRGVTEITGGPGTGKTVVALHRAAYLLYAERRRFEHGGILVIGPSAAYTAYIERVLPSLGEESVALRALGDVVDGVTARRSDTPEVAEVKGSLRIRRLLSRLAARAPEGSPRAFRSFVAGHAVRLDEDVLRRVRAEVLRGHQHNLAADAARSALAEAAWRSVRQGERSDFLDAFDASREVDEFMTSWWRPLDPRELLLTLADTDHAYAVSRGVLDQEEAAAIAYSYREALEVGEWSVSDIALADDLLARLGPVQDVEREEAGFYDIEELDDLAAYGVADVRAGARGGPAWGADSRAEVTPADARERLLTGRLERASGFAHVLVDEAQDLSPMQWRMVARRGRSASWTVVGDAAQASWPDLVEAGRAREEAFSGLERRAFHMDTNYRNAREIFDHARDVILPLVPDADIPDAVRETGVHPVDRVVEGSLAEAAADAVEQLLGEVDGSIAVVTPRRWEERLAALDGAGEGRVQVIDPLSTKGLEWDATVVVDPDAVTEESPGGVRVLYVVLTRAAHRMHVLRPA